LETEKSQEKEEDKEEDKEKEKEKEKECVWERSPGLPGDLSCAPARMKRDFFLLLKLDTKKHFSCDIIIIGAFDQ